MKNITKRLLCLMTAIGLLCALTGCDLLGGNRAAAKTFTQGDFSITLTDQFEVWDEEGFYAAYLSSNTGIAVVRDDRSYFGDISLEDYVELSLYYGGHEDLEYTRQGDGFLACYTDTIDGMEYYYHTYFYENESAFWVVNMWTLRISTNIIEKDFPVWADSIEITN